MIAQQPCSLTQQKFFNGFLQMRQMTYKVINLEKLIMLSLLLFKERGNAGSLSFRFVSETKWLVTPLKIRQAVPHNETACLALILQLIIL